MRRATLRRLVDSLPKEDLATEGRLLIGLAVLLAPPDDEPDTDNDDGGLAERAANSLAVR